MVNLFLFFYENGLIWKNLKNVNCSYVNFIWRTFEEITYI